jgi:hypothetical protein
VTKDSSMAACASETVEHQAPDEGHWARRRLLNGISAGVGQHDEGTSSVGPTGKTATVPAPSS